MHPGDVWESRIPVCPSTAASGGGGRMVDYLPGLNFQIIAQYLNLALPQTEDIFNVSYLC